MFKVVIMLEDVSTHETFAEAFAEFYRKTKQLVEEGTTWQVLESANFIVHTMQIGFEKVDVPMNFYLAKDLAHSAGLLTDNGKLADPLPEVPSPFVEGYCLALYMVNTKKRLPHIRN